MNNEIAGRSAQLAADVMTEIERDARLSDARIAVEARGTTVALFGVVGSWSDRFAAQDAAHRAQGVLDVVNELSVSAPCARGITDDDLARAGRVALRRALGASHQAVRCTVNQGSFTLEGTVETSSAPEEAEAALRKLAGVHGIVNKLEVACRSTPVSELREAIAAALRRRAAREAEGVELQVEDGTVTVLGVVDSRADKNAIVAVIKSTTGVRAVDDRLQINP